jgi:hypothetical protein
MKTFLSLIILTLSLLACRQDAPFPDINDSRLLLTPSAKTLVSGKYTFTVPEGAISSPTEFAIDESSLCNYVYPANDIYLFRCITSFSPQNSRFQKPVTLTITEDRYWLRPVNELSLAQDYPVERLRLYEINTLAGRAIELPGARVQIKGDQISISAQINHLGDYQIGIPRSEIQFVGGRMEAILTGEINKTVRIESNKTGSGGVFQQSEYLSNYTSTVIGMYADPKNPLEADAIQIVTSETKVGIHNVITRLGENVAIVIYIQNGQKYTVTPFLDEPATIRFTRYEQPGGMVEGSYRTLGVVTPGDKVVRMTINFSVRRIL